jgi:hypothetical protein
MSANSSQRRGKQAGLPEHFPSTALLATTLGRVVVNESEVGAPMNELTSTNTTRWVSMLPHLKVLSNLRGLPGTEVDMSRSSR